MPGHCGGSGSHRQDLLDWKIRPLDHLFILPQKKWVDLKMVCPHFQGLIMVHQWLIIIFPYFPYSSGQEWGFFFHFQKHLHILRMHWSSLCSAHAAGRHWVPGEYPDNKIQQNCLFFSWTLPLFLNFGATIFLIQSKLAGIVLIHAKNIPYLLRYHVFRSG